MIIGITGSFGSGKTTVANMFRSYGFKVINVDKLYKGIYNKDKSLKNKIKKEFGTINRNELKKIVFNNSSKLKKLNNTTNTIIIKEIKKEISTINKKYNKKIPIIKIYNNIKLINKKTIMGKNNKKYIEKNNIRNNVKIVIDAPLLIEAKAENLVDKLIVVKCSKKEQINRILKKRKNTKKEINNIIKSQ